MNFENYIKIGTLLEVEYNDPFNGPVKVKTVVEDGLENNQFAIATPMHKNISSPIQVGEFLRISFLVKKDDFEKPEVYVFTAKVRSRMAIDDMPILGMTITSEPKSFQRRDYFRVAVIKQFQLQQDGITRTVQTKNISASGMKLMTNGRLKDDVFCELNFQLEDEAFTIESKVVDQSPVTHGKYSHEIAVKFIDMKEIDRKRLIKILYVMQSDALRKKLRPNQYGHLYEDLYGNFKEKRTFEDRRVRVIRYITALSWFLGFIAFGLINQARPRHSFGIEVFFNEVKGNMWDPLTLNAAFAASVLLLGLSLTGAYLNSTRLKREGDRFHYSLIFMSVLSIIIITLYFVLKMVGV